MTRDYTRGFITGAVLVGLSGIANNLLIRAGVSVNVLIGIYAAIVIILYIAYFVWKRNQHD